MKNQGLENGLWLPKDNILVKTEFLIFAFFGHSKFLTFKKCIYFDTICFLLCLFFRVVLPFLCLLPQLHDWPSFSRENVVMWAMCHSSPLLLTPRAERKKVAENPYFRTMISRITFRRVWPLILSPAQLLLRWLVNLVKFTNPRDNNCAGLK